MLLSTKKFEMKREAVPKKKLDNRSLQLFDMSLMYYATCEASVGDDYEIFVAVPVTVKSKKPKTDYMVAEYSGNTQYLKPIKADMRVRCSCSDYKAMFAKSNNEYGLHFGLMPMLFKSKGKRESRNPDFKTGYCKHVAALIEYANNTANTRIKG